MRVERNLYRLLVATDVTKSVRNPTVRTIDGRRFFVPTQPYHACWIYTQQQMKEFVQRKAWADGNHEKWHIRERAAAGMIWSDSGSCRLLLPLGANGTVPKEAYIYHLGNPYIVRKRSRHGKLRVSKVVGILTN